MRLRQIFLAFLLILPVLTAVMWAESKNLADYPLRIHIFRKEGATFYRNRTAEEAKGQGRANLFENSQPRGLDFSFDCPEPLQTSSGFETFPAKWKKPNEELLVLIPKYGKPGNYFTCKLKVEMKDFTYAQRNGVLGTGPIAGYKKWMDEHDYDPEHGKNVPTQKQPAAPPPGQTPASAPPGSDKSTPQ